MNSNRLQEIDEIENLDLLSLEEVSFISNPMTRSNKYRYSAILQFPSIRMVDERLVTPQDRERAEVSLDAIALMCSFIAPIPIAWTTIW